jgi:hypothetical protein
MFNIYNVRVRVFKYPTSASCETLEGILPAYPPNPEQVPECLIGFINTQEGSEFSTSTWQTVEGGRYLIYVDSGSAYGSFGLRVIQNTEPCKDSTIINMKLGGLIPSDC